MHFGLRQFDYLAKYAFWPGMAIALHRRHFAIFVTQAKCDAIIRCDNDLDQWIRLFCDN